jgi:hypothetical protein
MRFISVNNQYLIRLASNSLYNHLSSLRPVRVQLVRYKPASRGCCHGDRKPISLTEDIVGLVTSSPKFLEDMNTLKRLLSLDSIIINLSSFKGSV